MKLSAISVTKDFTRQGRGTNILEAVKEATLDIEGGCLTALSGPSGSGKSTLLNMLAGLLRPTSGGVTLDGRDIYSLDDDELSGLRNRHFGIIPQGQTSLMALTVMENVLVPYVLYNRAKGEEYEKTVKYARDLLDTAGIADLENVMPSELSGGELRRLAVCRAMIMKPEIILADEPTGDLDEENTAVVMELLKESALAGRGVLVVTHDSQVYGYADRICRMRKGTVSAQEEVA